MRNRALHGFAVFTACCTFLLIIAGALVTGNDAGLAVPDWPLSYGSLTPPMVGGIFYEHGHRMVASFVGFLTIILAIWLWKNDDPRPFVRKLGWIALMVVVTQGILGRDHGSLLLASTHFGDARVPGSGFLLHCFQFGVTDVRGMAA